MIYLKPIILFILICPSLVFALTERDQRMLKEHGVAKEKIMLHTDKWGVKPSKIDIDGFVYKGQGKSIIDWKMSHEDWLDFEYWKEQRDARDKLPDWKIRLREIKHVEMVAKVIKCFGICNIFRGKYRVDADYMSRIYEGDEIITEENSYAWVAGTDGSIFRVSPKSSMTFNEVNIGVKDIYYFVRLNYGHIHWQVRKLGVFKEQNLAETDMMFYPLMLKEVNREFYSIKEYSKMDHDERLLYHTRKNLGHVSQYKKLNDYMEDNKEVLGKKNSHIFLVALNSTYHVKNGHFDLFYPTNGIAKFRFYSEIDGFKNNDPRETKVTAFLRGYNNTTEEILEEKQWYKVSNDGKSIDTGDFDQQFKTISLFVKRIPTIQLAREVFIRNTFNHLIEKEQNPEKMATEYGYRLWDVNGKEFKNRLAYLKEYTRRVETTNVHSTNKIFKDRKSEDFNRDYYAKGLSEQIVRLKTLYDRNRSVVPELNELQFYIWILKHAKKR